MPCADPLNCPGTDLPVINVSSERQDVAVSFGYHFERHYSQVCESTDPAIVALCNPIPPYNPEPPLVHSNDAQTCTENCPGDIIKTYTVPAGSILAMTRARANELAMILACRGATAMCFGDPPTLFLNTPQSCSYPCVVGPARTYTTPAGTFADLTQEEADAAAYAFACELAALICGGPPGGGGSGPGGTTGGTGTGGGPGPSGLPGSGGGSGTPPPSGTPPLVFYNNAAQTATATCGSDVFSYTTPAAMFRNTSFAAANASALSYAQNQVALLARCLGNLARDHFCSGFPLSLTVTQTGVGTAAQMHWDATAMPPGLTFVDGVISGTPTGSGSYTFTVQAVNAFNGVEAHRDYTITIQDITTTSLPGATESTAYDQVLAIAGSIGDVAWVITSGALPTGLVLDAATGSISGTPTLPDEQEDPVTFNFTVGATSNGLQCTRSLSIEVTPVTVGVEPVEWWAMEEPSGARVGSIQSIQLVPTDIGGGIDIVGQPGVVGDAATYIKGAFVPEFMLMVGEITTDLAYVLNTGITFFGWGRRTTGTDPHLQAFSPRLYLYTDALGTQLVGSLSLEDGGVAGTARVIATNEFAFIDAAVSHPTVLGEKFFWCLQFNPDTHEASVSINAGVPVTSFPLALTEIPSAAYGQVQILFGGHFQAAECQFDETAVYYAFLSQAQIEYLYNAGLGRTWPNTLPP